ncbi:hypothetical protein ACWXWU_19175 [Shewanella sp. A14]
MIKLVILGCFVCWMFIRQLSKSKPNSIWRIKLRRFSRYVLIGAVAWLITVAFGSVKYQIYTDKTFTYQGKAQTVFAWQENRLLPIKSFATPVLLSLDYQTSYPISDKTTTVLAKQYPYEPYPLGIGQFLGTLLSFLLLLSYVSRHRHTDKKWQNAVESDTKSEYKNFIKWSRSNPLRLLHCKTMEKKAAKAMQSIDQRGRLKLEMYRQGYATHGLNSPFLEMLSAVVNSGHGNITVRAEHSNNVKVLSDTDDVANFIANASALKPKLFMEKYANRLLEIARNRETPSKFDPHVLNSREYLRFTYPEPNIANQLLEKQLVSVLNQGKKRFIGDDIVQFNSQSDASIVQSDVCLEFTYMCNLDRKDGERMAAMWGGDITHKTITMDKVELPGGHMLWFVFGMFFSWRLVVDGAEVTTGNGYTLPDSNVCNLSRPTKREMPAKSEVEKQIFEVVALSNVSSLFAQLMGLNKDNINNHMIEFTKETAFDVKHQTEKSNQLAQSLEDALRGEALEELMLSSGKVLYEQNKQAVDAVIRDYIQNNGDTDTVMMIINLLGDSVPELTSGLLEIIGGSDE